MSEGAYRLPPRPPPTSQNALDQISRLHDALRQAGVPPTLRLITGAGHDGAGSDTAEIKELFREFLDRHLEP